VLWWFCSGNRKEGISHNFSILGLV